MFGLGPTEILIVFAFFILLFGAKRLPEIAKGLGRGIREFKGEINSIEDTQSKPSVK